ncbi:hypothetical protein C1752_08698 [Acaryochloris thomasi RCC1774]|uniref:DUF4278 domain-containing protein n=1 Tax=Acaryochloris thomasi RCC1774 TaxID=1764569 RepID=A0A2W1J9G6_9CYAN|nr:DUF4278 domain-containing protein [Acaryochloris thomasi]PZD70923.1 hypothetical protein C1752_08698 [Acaryochloris thomasi RCC1774]
MQLKYRGVTYDYTPPDVNYGKQKEAGKYRGVAFPRHILHEFPVTKPEADLTYRGVEYRTAGQKQPAAAGCKSATDEARWLMMNHHRAIKQRQQSMLGRLTADIHMVADPTQYWNHIQGKVHPSFRATYDRSAAAMS